jgi:pyrroline-5-carboxylate reductase
MLQDKRIAVIGAGNIGRILLERLRVAGLPADQLSVVDADPARAQSAAASVGASVASLAAAAGQADILLLAAPPKATPAILRAMAPHLRAGQLVVSFAAGVPLALIERLLPAGVSAARVMPNAPSLIGQGMNPVAFGASITPATRQEIEELLAALGQHIVVGDTQMNWCVGLTGAAMRSLLPALEGMTRAGVEAGLSPADARRVAARVMLGVGALALNTDLSFEALKALTPMQTLDEPALAQILYDAARGAKEKVDAAQHKLLEAEEQSIA